MRRKHLTFGIVFLVLFCSFIALVAVSQQKTLRQLENEMETAYKNLYNPAYGVYPQSNDHKTWISSCSETDSNGNTCTNTSGYWECSPHTHTYSKTCTQCGVSYNPNNSSAANRHRVLTCRLCGKTWHRCQGSKPICDKPYRKRNGLSCVPPR